MVDEYEMVKVCPIAILDEKIMKKKIKLWLWNLFNGPIYLTKIQQGNLKEVNNQFPNFFIDSRGH